MRKANENQRRKQYKGIEIIPYIVKTVKTAEEADIVLTKRKDLCDFLALGFYCLRVSMQNLKKSDVKVFYSSKYFKGNSGFSVMCDRGEMNVRRNALSDSLYRDILPVFEYIYDVSESEKHRVRVMAILMYSELTARIDNLYSNEQGKMLGISAQECIKTFKMDSMKAQQRAYETACKNLNRMFV